MRNVGSRHQRKLASFGRRRKSKIGTGQPQPGSYIKRASRSERMSSLNGEVQILVRGGRYQKKGKKRGRIQGAPKRQNPIT